MAIILAAVALLCIGLPACGVIYLARPNTKGKVALLSVVLCLTLGAMGYWFGHRIASMDSNAYYTFRIKKLLTYAENQLEKEHDVSIVAQDLRRMNEALPFTYEKRPDLDALISGATGEQPK